MKKEWFLILIGLLFAGCAPSTFSEMKSSDSIKSETVMVDKNYENIYRKSLSKARECYEMGLITGAVIADGQLYPSAKEGEIVIYTMGGLGKSISLGATFKEIEQNKTQIRFYATWGETSLKRMERLFLGEAQGCN